MLPPCMSWTMDKDVQKALEQAESRFQERYHHKVGVVYVPPGTPALRSRGHVVETDDCPDGYLYLELPRSAAQPALL